ncbi:P-loop containing nucleoside triphosphate hydrolase protein [Chlamydoabsidia padenii]|nr:P-loop containing nucleoside triphosphate hydrolase protein [Chlamydoabsidia padenii]
MDLHKLSHDVRIDEDIDFGTLIQNPLILKGLELSGYARPSPIQLQAIPLGRLGVDMIAQAKSGTGKTVVFAVIALEAIQPSITSPQALIVAPTREIAIQIKDVVQQLGQAIPQFHCEVLIGGLSMEGDIRKLQRAQVIVGTPGRLMALLETKKLPTKTIKLLVLDEADKLMSDTFRQQIRYIYGKLGVNKQSVAFSATFTDELLASLNDFVHQPQIVKLTHDLPTLEEVQQYYVDLEVGKQDKSQQQQQTGDYLRKMEIYKAKFEGTADLLSKVDFYQCMVFVNSFPRAAELAKWLTEMGWRSGHICAGLSQEKRMVVMKDMRQFKLRVLVCSDLIARGIDIDRVNLVINVDYPRNTETYLHRVGRTGRYGTSGIAVNLIATDEDRLFLKSLHDQKVSIPPLPDHVSFSDYRKELDKDELQLWQKHQVHRTKKERDPIEFRHKERKPPTDKTMPGTQHNTKLPTHKTIPGTQHNTKPPTHKTRHQSPIMSTTQHKTHESDSMAGTMKKRRKYSTPTAPNPSLPPPPPPPPPFILPPFPLFPSRRQSHWIPPDLFF